MITLAFVIGTIAEKHALVSFADLNEWCAGSREGRTSALHHSGTVRKPECCARRRSVEAVPLRGFCARPCCPGAGAAKYRVSPQPVSVGQRSTDLERHGVPAPGGTGSGVGWELVRLWRYRGARGVL